MLNTFQRRTFDETKIKLFNHNGKKIQFVKVVFKPYKSIKYGGGWIKQRGHFSVSGAGVWEEDVIMKKVLYIWT